MITLDFFYTFLLYAAVFFLTILLAQVTRKTKSLILRTIIVMLPCFLLLCFRKGIGTDYYNYEQFYDLQLADADWINFEIGFKWLVFLSDRFTGEYSGFIYISSFLTCFLFFSAFIKISEPKQVSIFFFLGMCLYFSIWFAAIRQVLAMGFSLWAFIMMERRKKRMFILLVFLASLFHLSALMLLPCILISSIVSNISSNRATSRIVTAIIMSVIFVIVFPYLELSGLVYSSYIGNSSEGGITYMMALLGLMMYPFEIRYMKPFLRKDSYNAIYYLFIVVEFATFVLSMSVAYAFRFGQYFSIAHPILITRILASGIKVDKYMKLYTYLIFAFYFCFTVFSLGHNGISSYKFFIPW